MEIDKKILKVMNELKSKGYDTYLVGGAVRDCYFDKIPNDYDLACNATVSEMTEALNKFKVFLTGERHNTITVLNGKHVIEVTSFKGGSIREDLMKRDFTINAIAYDSKVIALENTLDDIKNKIVRVVDGEQTILDDPLRILRAIRQCYTYNCTIEEETLKIMNNHIKLLDTVSKERIRDELFKILVLPNSGNIIKNHLEIFLHIIPELKECVGFEQNNKYHQYDIFDHTIEAMNNSVCDLDVRLSLLFHDVGKPQTYVLREGRGTFYGHNVLSAEICKKVMKMLKCSNQLISDVCKLVIHHDDVINLNRKSVRKYLRKTDVNFEKLLQVKYCDIMAQSAMFRNRLHDLAIIEDLYKSILKEQECFSLKDLDVNGRDLYDIGYRGSEIGTILDKLLDAVIEEQVKNNKSSLISYINNKNML